MDMGERQDAYPAHENGGGQRFADPAKGQGTKGDAELDRGKEVVQIALQAADCAGAGDAGSQHLFDAGVADGDQGELGGHKKSIDQNEQAHGDELEQHKTKHPGCENSREQGIGNRQLRTPSPMLLLWNQGVARCV
jgi:hypothetical protein